MGATQLLSVPYALYANEAGNSTTPLSIELSFSNDTLYFTDDSYVVLPFSHGKVQALSLSNDTLYLSNSNYIVLPPPTSLNVSLNPVATSCSGVSDGEILVSVTGGLPPYSFDWSTGDTTSSLENLSSGSYQLTVTDRRGEFVSRSTSVNSPALLSTNPSINHVKCFNANNGSIQLNINGGSYIYDVQWNHGPSNQNLYELDGREYIVDITDSKGCSLIDTIQIDEPSDSIFANAVITNATCYGQNNGSIDLTVTGGKSPYSYFWEITPTYKYTEDIDNLEAQQYHVRITDDADCQIWKQFTVGLTSKQINISGNETDVNCFGGNTGGIDISITGGAAPFTYLWSNAETTEDIVGVDSGIYKVNVTDLYGCKDSASFSIIEPSTAILISLVNKMDEFKDSADGSITISVTGGDTAYTFSWDNGSTEKDITNLSAGTYSVTVTDNNGCTENDSYSISSYSNVTDIDGNTYDIVKIGEQVWMQENLKVTKFNDGWIIPETRIPNNESVVSEYGLLYNQSTVSQGNLCPTGWHVPTSEEWAILINYLKGSSIAGGYLKEEGTIHWQDPNVGATNESGFTALPAGYCGTSSCSYFGSRSFMYSSSGSIIFMLYFDGAYISSQQLSAYLSVRCVKD